MQTTKVYRCLNCGHAQRIVTNHFGRVADYCGRLGMAVDDSESAPTKDGCSWKPSFGDGLQIPFNGRTYREFAFISEVL